MNAIKDPDKIAKIINNSLLFFWGKSKNMAITISKEIAKGGLRLKEIDWFTQKADSPLKDFSLRYVTIQPKLPAK